MIHTRPIFTDLYEDEDEFIEDYKASKLYCNALSDEFLSYLYYSIYGNFGNNEIANSDENQWRYKFYRLISAVGPKWQKHRALMLQLSALDSDLTDGGCQTYNQTSAPGDGPEMSSEESAGNIDHQTKTLSRKSLLRAVAEFDEIMDSDLDNQYLSKFKDLFAFTGYDAIYVTDIGENDYD